MCCWGWANVCAAIQLWWGHVAAVWSGVEHGGCVVSCCWGWSCGCCLRGGAVLNKLAVLMLVPWRPTALGGLRTECALISPRYSLKAPTSYRGPQVVRLAQAEDRVRECFITTVTTLSKDVTVITDCMRVACFARACCMFFRVCAVHVFSAHAPTATVLVLPAACTYFCAGRCHGSQWHALKSLYVTRQPGHNTQAGALWFICHKECRSGLCPAALQWQLLCYHQRTITKCLTVGCTGNYSVTSRVLLTVWRLVVNSIP